MHAIRHFLGLVALPGAIILLGTSPAEAQKVKRNALNPNAPILMELHATVAVLKQADHDYKGHRVKAIRQIHLAVKALGGNHSGAKIPGGSGKLLQPMSDALLHKALQNLHAIQTVIANTQGPGNRAAAVAALQNALAELHTALNIR